MRPLPWRVLRRFKHIGLLLLMLFTAYLVAGRLLMPLLSTRKGDIEATLAKATGLPVSIGALNGAWFRFGPVIDLGDLRLGAAGAEQHRVRRAQASLDVLGSLLARRPVISSISVSDLTLSLVETAPGRWTLAGLVSSGPGSLDPLLDFLLGTNELTLREANVRLQRLDGSVVSLGSIIVNLQNSGSQHEMQLQLRINGQELPARMIVQLQGDPRRIYTADLWLDTADLDWLPLLRDRLPPSWQWQALAGRTQVWATLDSNGLQDLKVALQDVRASANAEAGGNVIALDHGTLQLGVKAVPGLRDEPARWQVRAQQLDFDWANVPWQVPTLLASNTSEAASLWQVSASEIDLAMVQRIVTDAVPMPAAARQALLTLAPTGRLRNVQFETAADGSHPQGFVLRGNLDEVAVNAWQQAPSGRGLNGYVEANLAGGFAEVDSNDLTLHLPLLFEEPWHYDHVNTRVSWRASRDHVQVQTALVDVASPQIEGSVRFAVENTRNEAGLWHNEFSLEVGVDRIDTALAPQYLPTLPRLTATNDWLKAALQGGEVIDSGFVLHTIGGPAAPRGNNTEVLSWYRVRNGVLKFLPDWPALTGLVAGVVERGNNIDIEAYAGELAGVPVQRARAEIRPNAEGLLQLAVRTHADTTTQSGLDLLRNTPVRASIGDVLDTWNAAGQIAIDVGVGVDLSGRGVLPMIDVRTHTVDSQLGLTPFDLRFTDIVGDVRYSSRQGLTADALQAKLFDYPLSAGIATEKPGSAGQTIVIAGRGQGSVPALESWAGLPSFVRALVDYMEGEFDYDATVTIEPAVDGAPRQTHLKLDSDLMGVTSGLPLPLAKSAAEARPLNLELQFGGSQQTLALRYHDWLSGALVLDAAGIQRGQLSVGERNRNFNVRQVDAATAGLLVSGDMSSFDVTKWQEVAGKLNASPGEGRAVADYLRLVDVKVGELVLPGRTLENANVVVQHPDDRWLINASNEFLAGVLTLPDDKREPWQLALDYLRFPPRPVVTEAVKEEDEIDPLQDVDPRTLPAFDFTTKELSFGDQNLGAFTFELRPNARGASIAKFQVTSPDSSITDSTRAAGASIEWEYSAGEHHSSFNGLFTAGDLAKVLPAWGHDANVVSSSASFDSQLHWQGSPLHFSLKRASGRVNLTIDDGRFVDIASGSTRLLGALNFDALVRRLQLDFSDIFAKGYSFDNITGLLDFTEGVVNTATPLAINGPSSDLAIEGEINLRDETISADMQVQIPLGQNLSMVAGLLGAWPIAVSTYLASKIFQNTVEEFTTVIYRLEGPWAAPTAGFEPPEGYDASAQPATSQQP